MSGLSDKLRQVSALNNCKGIHSFLDAAYAILENPIAMFNTEYELQAYTSVVTDDPIWNELITRGNFSYETQALFMQEGFIDTVANAETIALLTSDKIKYDRISCKLYNENHIHVSNLIIVACNRPFNDDDPIIFEAVCGVIAKEIMKTEFYSTYGKMYQETYIRKLVEGEVTEKALYAAHIAIVYSGFKSSMRLAVADIGNCDPGGYARLTYFRDLFWKTQSEFEYAIYQNYIIIIISSNNPEFNAERDFGKLYELIGRNNINVGISSSFDNMYELRKYYFEAVGALTRGLSNNGGGRFFLYE